MNVVFEWIVRAWKWAIIGPPEDPAVQAKDESAFASRVMPPITVAIGMPEGAAIPKKAACYLPDDGWDIPPPWIKEIAEMPKGEPPWKRPVPLSRWVEPSEKEIAYRAYCLWLGKGRPDGGDKADWEQAREDLGSTR